MPSVSSPPGTLRASKHRHRVPHPAQRMRTGEPRRAGSDDGHPFSRRRSGLEELEAAATRPCRKHGAEAGRSAPALFMRIWSTQAPSQSTSVGQARAQLPPKTLASRIVWAAESSS